MVQGTGWKGLLGKAWRAFVAGFVGGAVMSLTSIFDQLSKGADLGGNWPKALLTGVILGGLTAAFRALYAVLPLDNADNGVGLAKQPAPAAPADAAARAATDAAKATTEATQAANRAAEQATHAVDAVNALVAGLRLGSAAAAAYQREPDGEKQLSQT